MKTEFNKKTGIVLKEARINAGLKQNEAAEKLGRRKQWLCDIETGRSSIMWKDMKALCELYNTTPSDVSRKIDNL